MQRKISSPYKHKYNYGPLNIRTAVKSDAGIFSRKPPGGHGSESMAKGIKKIHPKNQQHKTTGYTDYNIGEP